MWRSRITMEVVGDVRGVQRGVLRRRHRTSGATAHQMTMPFVSACRAGATRKTVARAGTRAPGTSASCGTQRSGQRRMSGVTAHIAGARDVVNQSGTSVRGGLERLECGRDWATLWTFGNDRGKKHTTTRRRTKWRMTDNGVDRGGEGRVRGSVTHCGVHRGTAGTPRPQGATGRVHASTNGVRSVVGYDRSDAALRCRGVSCRMAGARLRAGGRQRAHTPENGGMSGRRPRHAGHRQTRWMSKLGGLVPGVARGGPLDNGQGN